MTIKDVKKALTGIRRDASRKNGYEDAHSAEDDLFKAVLQTIASGNARNPATLAAEALKATELDYARHCA